MRASFVALGVVLALALAPALALPQQTEIASIEAGAHAVVAYSNVEKPVDITFGPDGTLYYASFEVGELRRVNADGTNTTLWKAPNLQLGGERGFVGLAVAPDFATSHAFFVNYQTNKSGTVVTRLSKVVDGQETVLLDDIRSAKLHNSGRIVFDTPTTMLMSVGDATLDTIGRDASLHAHDPNVVNGKVLRLNLDGTAAAGNPWGNAVWTKGHRNVYGIAVSPDGVVLATENGPDHWDEVNILEAGKDYGWPTCSGACDDARYVNPILAYDSTIAPTGAVWYEGAFYFTDFNKGRVHRVLQAQDGAWLDQSVLKFTTPRIIDIAVGPDGLYVSTWDAIWKLTPAKVQVPTKAPPPVATPPEESAATPAPATPSMDGSASIEDGRDTPGLGVLAAVFVAVAALVRGRR